MGSVQTVQHDLRGMAPSQTSMSSLNKAKLYTVPINPGSNVPPYQMLVFERRISLSLYKAQKSLQIYFSIFIM